MSQATDPESIDRHKSPFSLKENLGRLLWGIAQATFFRLSPKRAYKYRASILRCFGAKLAKQVRIRPTVRIEIPWNIEIGEHSTVGDFADLYSLGKIRIGRYATISQHAYICAGTHDPSTPAMTLLLKEVVIEDHAWVAARSFVGPGVTVGKGSILGAQSSLFKNLEPHVVAAGCPARVIKPAPRRFED